MKFKFGDVHQGVLLHGDIASADVTLVSDEWTKIGEYSVPAGMAVGIGYGALKGMHDALGRIYAELKDTSDADVSGKVRISYYSPQDRLIKIIHEFHTSQLLTSATDKRQQYPLPFCGDMVTEDKKIVVEVKSTGAAIDYGLTTIVIDTTIEEF